MRPPFTGIIPPMATPLLGRDELDVDGLERLIEHILAGGVGGLFILGTTGEGPSLSYRLRRELIKRVCRQVSHRVPVLVGITDTSFVESIRLAQHAANAGANAVVAAPPYYLPEAQPELQEYLCHLLAELPLPVLLYNMPALTKVRIELETLLWALDNPGIIGLKDSSGDLEYFRNALAIGKDRSDWSVLIGPEEKLLDALQWGGHGGVNGGANLFPQLYVKLVEAYRLGDFNHARALQAQIRRVGDALYHIGKHPSSVIKGIKCGLACLGICNDFMAEPFHRFRTDERKMIEMRLEQIQAEVAGLHI